MLVGEAGRRLQGLLGKLGITKSYTIINAYLYSVYGSVKAKTAKNPELIAYRNLWIDAVIAGGKIEGVLALGMAADQAWQTWKQTPIGLGTNLAYCPY